MLLHIPQVLSQDRVRDIRQALLHAAWTDGRGTAGHQSGQAKHNRQVPEDDPLARRLGEEIAQALSRLPLFVSSALPRTLYPPVFSCYGPGDRFDTHVDNAIRYGHGGRMRADLSATLFLSEVEEYKGGALVIEDQFGIRDVRLPAGDLVLYPSSSLHHVTPIVRGERMAAIIWIQSLIRDDGKRRVLFEMDQQLQALAADLAPDLANDRRIVALTGVYHNLVRRWAEL